MGCLLDSRCVSRFVCVYVVNVCVRITQQTRRIILAFAAFHIYWAAIHPLPFVIYYVCALLIPIFFFVLSFAIIKENNENWSRTRIYRMRVWISTPKKTAPKPSSPDAAQEEGQADSAAAADGAQQDASQEVLVTQIPEPNNPYTKKISMHLHHWQIFYMLAYFTR